MEAVEDGAAGIAIVLSNLLLERLVNLHSRRGTGFDYFLGDRNVADITEAELAVTSAFAPLLKDEELIVRGRLEVLGTMSGTDAQISGKVNQKLQQTDASDHLGIPAHVIALEFGRLIAEVREK